MSTDRELLELAAKAAGHEWKWDQPRGSRHGWLRILVGDRWVVWNPVNDDGEALRLAVRLGFDVSVRHRDKQTEVAWNVLGVDPFAADALIEPHDDCARAATRRAIVRAAAEIGKATP